MIIQINLQSYLIIHFIYAILIDYFKKYYVAALNLTALLPIDIAVQSFAKIN